MLIHLSQIEIKYMQLSFAPFLVSHGGVMMREIRRRQELEKLTFFTSLDSDFNVRCIWGV
jgi:hypothetical protein